MKKLFPFFLFVLFALPLFSEERIVDTIENVDLYVNDLYNEDDHNYGEEYYVLNRNDFPMHVSIHLTDNKNAEKHLIKSTVIVGSNLRGDLGHILQKDLSLGATWKYEWKAERD
ncbi:MAG: hypothetical protein K940chlam7_00489 [Chlamydiae bacterium]|nr:hypothetical protein [Chlamydiota bacterium]